MARYIGDLTDPNNGVERQKAANMVNEVAQAIRNREVRDLIVTYNREVIGIGQPGAVSPAMSPWTVSVEVTQRGRHER